MYASAESASQASADRIRRSTTPDLNEHVDQITRSKIRTYVNSKDSVILQRIQELDEEWDVERVLDVNASTLALSGLVLGLTVNRKWLALPAVVLTFLFQQGVQGWCPPLPLLRWLGIRTRGEIDREKYALKSLSEQR